MRTQIFFHKYNLGSFGLSNDEILRFEKYAINYIESMEKEIDVICLPYPTLFYEHVTCSISKNLREYIFKKFKFESITNTYNRSIKKHEFKSHYSDYRQKRNERQKGRLIIAFELHMEHIKNKEIYILCDKIFMSNLKHNNISNKSISDKVRFYKKDPKLYKRIYKISPIVILPYSN
ncbi:hypothetical protein LGZ99_22475 [Photorhabdus temperata]|uniref:Photorhabdus luminescens subsp. laumondii TTO1 complete genome segment 10/17 n=1 Tax=Photorhabdus laumondii subsp. laumondii (strain DSM 15139 / CIP 105565 / TT01) TaxID=243265 RepID=Q7N2Z4_PHOLL|nr:MULTISPECIES: hypothetical protein [Photorhabdus]AWK42636.1 hypothetical protein A4R40_14615 [Photorhabdus laumondii subsp. laumondii]AXG47960.1 hypothetical protein PluTT01m_15035 [Photorhabdus laumondii subsp. laumondii]MCT8349889.1 hypothetical protein [Photorhabdus temperata]CAE15303.1 unnamed protein product [Photorhabdus laumondii subsp. laumondii TTO1]